MGRSLSLRLEVFYIGLIKSSRTAASARRSAAVADVRKPQAATLMIPSL